ncbi:hypothetical protein PHLGIDRAFT_166532 [Phlebiopsis gigantea 11061_1 CR5-6]|uniref:Uncharacterized protein n=1 Tax=Phlebiopsis gigantea (strain 11061_1 CR5-6) TaxID=745531 RepID=A0A0C3NJL7_PHLG1|nr:hypothetical protein PHLGIDRAFT_166532 [Phlebiopsis gigantea 11061_1 CR5-6]
MVKYAGRRRSYFRFVLDRNTFRCCLGGTSFDPRVCGIGSTRGANQTTFEISRSMRWTRAADESSRVVYCVPPAKHLATCSFAHRQSLAGFAQFYRNVGLLLPQTRWTRTGSGGVKAASLTLAANGSVRARHVGKSKLNRVRRSPLNRTNRPGGLRHSGRCCWCSPPPLSRTVLCAMDLPPGARAPTKHYFRVARKSCARPGPMSFEEDFVTSVAASSFCFLMRGYSRTG